MMKFYSYTFFLFALLLFYSCEQRPARKKLPDVSLMQGWEQMPLAKKENPSFLVYDSSISQNGKLTDFFCVLIPDDLQDSVALHLALAYLPFLPSIINTWQKNKHKGFLIDLRNQEGKESRADFLVNENVSAAKEMKIPVVLLWNDKDVHRAEYYMNAMQAFPELECKLISDSRKIEGIGRNDCFSPTAPSFDQQ